MTWKHRINIKQFLSDDTSPAGVVRACDGVLSQLHHDLPYQPSLDRIRERLENCKAAAGVSDPSVVDRFNRILDDIYDYGDRERVWMWMAP